MAFLSRLEKFLKKYSPDGNVISDQGVYILVEVSLSVVIEILSSISACCCGLSRWLGSLRIKQRFAELLKTLFPHWFFMEVYFA